MSGRERVQLRVILLFIYLFIYVASDLLPSVAVDRLYVTLAVCEAFSFP